MQIQAHHRKASPMCKPKADLTRPITSEVLLDTTKTYYSSLDQTHDEKREVDGWPMMPALGSFRGRCICSPSPLRRCYSQEGNYMVHWCIFTS